MLLFRVFSHDNSIYFHQSWLLEPATATATTAGLWETLALLQLQRNNIQIKRDEWQQHRIRFRFKNGENGKCFYNLIKKQFDSLTFILPCCCLAIAIDCVSVAMFLYLGCEEIRKHFHSISFFIFTESHFRKHFFVSSRPGLLLHLICLVVIVTLRWTSWSWWYFGFVKDFFQTSFPFLLLPLPLPIKSSFYSPSQVTLCRSRRRRRLE